MDAGLLLTGLEYGSIGNSFESLLGDSGVVEAMGASASDDLVDGFYATSILTLGLIAAGFAISSAMRPRADEDGNRVELLLATGLSRSAWLGGHVVTTVGGTLLVVAAAGLGMGVGYAPTTGDGGAVIRFGGPMLAQVAPVLALSGLARMLYGVAPRLLVLAWVPLAFAVAVLVLGESLQIPQPLQDLSPFEHLALAPAESFRWRPVLVVAAIAAILSLAGQLSFRRRDIGAG